MIKAIAIEINADNALYCNILNNPSVKVLDEQYSFDKIGIARCILKYDEQNKKSDIRDIAPWRD